MIGKQKHKRSEKVLELTYKGAASVIALGATLEEVEAWARSTDSKNLGVIQHIKDQFPESHARDLWFQKAMQYGLKNNYFENNKAKNLTPLERTKMLQNFQMEYLNSLGPVANIDSMADLTKPTTLKEIMDRFGLDKYYLKGYLNYQKELIDMVIKQLDAMD
jgi:hypothetical protein